MDNLTFGRYSPYNTFTHKVDARSKIFALILLIATIFFRFTTWSTSILFSLIYLALFLIIMVSSRVSIIDLFKSLKSLWILIIFLMVIYVFIPNPNYSDRIAFYIGDFGVHWDAIYQSVYIVMRLLMMLILTMILTSTTKPMDLTYAFEWYMTPLKVIKFPVHEIAMTLSITLRFIPTLLDETKRIQKAQVSRGADFDGFNIFKKIKHMVSLIIPLFASAIDRSEDLSNAMEVKGYDPRAKRTRFRILRFTWRDLLILIFAISLFGAILALFIIDKNYYIVDVFEIMFGLDLGF